MTDSDQYRFAELCEKRINGTISDKEFAELESWLLKNGDARDLFLDLNYQHAGLQLLEDSLVQEQLHTPAQKSRFPKSVAIAALAACLVVLLSAMWNREPNPVATLVSSENAAWESSLPTNQGTDLIPGYLRLKSGVATIRFRSGAEVILEAPAHLVLETPMKGQLLAGSAVIDVPDSAIGFIMETPDGYAVDHGTQFAVSVNEESRRSAFEVLSGEISVHHPPTGGEVRLVEKQSSQVTPQGLETTSGPLPEGTLKPTESRLLRLETRGRTTSIIKNDDLTYLHSDMLMVKRSLSFDGFDRRSFLGFDVSGVDLSKVTTARLRLNLVPSGLGFAARLAELNQFSIYGITADWQDHLNWDSAPTPEQGTLLGTFEVPRSRQTGSFGIENEALLDYLKSRPDGIANLLLVRETREIKSNGLVHSFASDSHPEASGPILELMQTP
ncbi:MAG: FecR domain-containing protein [Verrucomicrobiales bacterium]|nr:FecR domain-containing protein [Verrucomicrobiales bacterium]